MKLFNEKLASLKSQEEVEDALRDIFDNQRTRIASALQLPEGVEVVLCPSGETLFDLYKFHTYLHYLYISKGIFFSS